jgi:lysophospholipase L1-like esterase
VILEFGSKVLYNKIAPEKGRKAIDSLVFNNQSSSTGNFDDGSAISEIEVLPYYLYRNKSFSKINGVQQVNSEGYRNGTKEFGKKEEGKIRIITIGGSTTFGWLIKDYQQTWPSQLEEMLNKKFNGQVEVINAGLPGGMSSESVVAFIMKDKFLEPDLVILHNGGNDLAPLLYDNYYPDYRYHRAIIGADKLRPGEKKIITKSNFVKLIYAFWFKDFTLSSVRSEPEQKIELAEAIKNVKKHSPIGFERNMTTLIQESKSVGAAVVLFPFHLASDKIYEVVPEPMRYAQKLHPAMVMAIAKNKEVLKTLAKKYNLPYHEMAADRIPLENFFDHCHMKPEGDRMKAEFIAQYVSPIVEKKLER